MVYKNFQDLKLSMLGLGCMRFPTVEGNDSVIDEEKTAEMFDYAMKQGINYYDTAWGYHSGNSEIVTGKMLNKYPRDSYYIATKFPGYDVSNLEKKEEVFEKQLEKTGMEYFDFYLCHCITDSNVDAYLDPKYDLINYLKSEKEKGRIRHLGFSAHSSLDTMKRFLDAWDGAMEFCQIQLNWFDWTFQQAKEKVELIRKYNIPVWVMEPVRGGKLAVLPEEYDTKLKALRNEEAPAWAFRFLQSIEDVTMILSGMSSFQQLSDNIHTFETQEPLNDEEFNAILGVADEMQRRNTVPCTECRYCTTYCPQGIDIPKLFSIYNEENFKGSITIDAKVLRSFEDDKKPSSCLGCRSCEAVCPQQIKISEVLADFAGKLK